MILIIHSPNLSNSEMLIEWSERSGFYLKSMDFSDIHEAIYKLLRINEFAKAMVVLIDYPIICEEDLMVLDEFIAYRTSGEEFWYYAPRPNFYLDVTSAALIAIRDLSNLKEYFHSPKNNFNLLPVLRAIFNFFPTGLKKVLRRLIKPLVNIKMRCKFSADQSQLKKIPSSEDRHNDLVPALPGALSPIPVFWKNWIPSIKLLNRDLLEKFDSFFPHPRGIHVVLLNKCNLECVMCPYHSPKYKTHHITNYFDEYRSMSKDIFMSIADYAGQNKIPLQFGQIEEPLMHKKIYEYLAYAKKVGVPQMHMTTNGTLLTNDRADLLVETGINSVMFSIDAATPETYSKIRGADLIELESNVRYFIKKSKGKKIKTWASFILQPQAVQEREKFLKKWREIGIDYVTFYVLTEHDPVTGEFIRFEENYSKGDRYPCASPWMQSVVFPGGEVSLCCKTMTDVGWRGIVDVGSLKQSSFSEIWRSDNYKQVRRELLFNNFERFKVCQNCQIWSASTSLTQHTADYIRTYNETMETYQFYEN